MKNPILALAGLLFMATCCFAQNQFEVLVLSIPDKYHYEYIPIARKSFEEMARQHQFQLKWTNDPHVFDGELKNYAAIVFLNTTGEVLSDTQRQKFRDFVQQGGGVMLVHAATATTQKWDWYDRLVGRFFRKHPYIQTGVIYKADPCFPATFSLPDRWVWSDEWYEYDAPLSKDLHVVLKVDEATYDPTRIWPGQHSEGMGADHPVAWYHHFEGARVFATALGHLTECYADKVYLDHLYGGLWWVATGKGIAAKP
ncbi:MAG: ThuA domain-containing protein [Verrucomicrobia bacterium]|nr:ThuA domain-containing protein [Verrucomicrobiota bacterium]